MSERLPLIAELLDRTLEYDMDSFQEMLTCFEPMVDGIYYDLLVRRQYYSKADWKAECPGIIWECVFRYRPSEHFTFEAFVRQTLTNKAVSLGRHEMKSYDLMFQRPLSLDYSLHDQNTPLYIADEQTVLNRSEVMDRVEFSIIRSHLRSRLTEQENTMLDLFYAGYSKAEICRMFDTGPKSVTRLLKKCRHIVSVDRLMRD